MRICLLVALALFTLGCSEQPAAQDENAPMKISTTLRCMSRSETTPGLR